VMVTSVPTGPLDGLNEVIVGAWAKALMMQANMSASANRFFFIWQIF
jgi:hypothetical protein